LLLLSIVLLLLQLLVVVRSGRLTPGALEKTVLPVTVLLGLDGEGAAPSHRVEAIVPVRPAVIEEVIAVVRRKQAGHRLAPVGA
jgi:hypothetical protein